MTSEDPKNEDNDRLRKQVEDYVSKSNRDTRIFAWSLLGIVILALFGSIILRMTGVL